MQTETEIPSDSIFDLSTCKFISEATDVNALKKKIVFGPGLGGRRGGGLRAVQSLAK